MGFYQSLNQTKYAALFIGLLLNGVTALASGQKGLNFISDDIVVFDNAPEMKTRTLDFSDDDCKANIKKVVCLVKDASNSDDSWGRECLPESEIYFPAFEAIYDQYPPQLQKMFCAVRKIFIEQNLNSTAYASPSGAIGIRASIIDEKLSLGSWATWKEQLSFGGNPKSYKVKADLPSFASTSTDNGNYFLFNVIAHEFGHLFDFANDLNESDGFKMKAGSWGDLSWTSFSKPKAAFDFTNRNKICFYDCGSHPLKKEVIPTLYADLTKSNFLNTYTSRNPYEDFADTFAFYVMFNTVASITYSLDTQQGAVYDIRKQLASDRMKPKVDYVKAFLAGASIKYPD